MSTHYKNIIVAVDGSEASHKAFKQALTLATLIDDMKLIITHVIDTRTFATAEAYDRTLVGQTEKHAEELLQRYAEEAEKAGIKNYVQCLEFGSPKVKITKDIVKEYDADLIICGATGVNAVERFLIGSVSENITRHATCDVLVVR